MSSLPYRWVAAVIVLVLLLVGAVLLLLDGKLPTDYTTYAAIFLALIAPASSHHTP